MVISVIFASFHYFMSLADSLDGMEPEVEETQNKGV